MRYQLCEKPRLERRGEALLAIFPSRPYWFVGTVEIEHVLECLSSGVTADIANRRLSAQLGVTNQVASEYLSEVIALLNENGVLLIDGQIRVDAPVIEPHFQVNEVENVLIIATTQGCNLACPHCYAAASRPLSREMTTQEICRLLDDLADMPWSNTVSRVGFTGGEFFLRPDALTLVDYAASLGFHLIISTNGTLLDDQTIAQLATYTDLKVSISLDGPDASQHEYIRGAGTFIPTVRSISRLSDAGAFVGTNMFVHRHNLASIEQTLVLADKLGVQAFNTLNLMWVGRARSRRSQQQLERVSIPELYLTLFGILRVNERYRQMMRNSTFANQLVGIAAGVKCHYCGIGTNRALYVKADGTIYPCPDSALPPFRLGNVQTTDLATIWSQSTILAHLRTLNVDTMNPVCAACSVRYFCGGGCRGENYQANGGNLLAPHVNCEEYQQAIVEMMWMLYEEPDLFQDKVDALYDAVS